MLTSLYRQPRSTLLLPCPPNHLMLLHNLLASFPRKNICHNLQICKGSPLEGSLLLGIMFSFAAGGRQNKPDLRFISCSSWQRGIQESHSALGSPREKNLNHNNGSDDGKRQQSARCYALKWKRGRGKTKNIMCFIVPLRE